MKQLTRKQTRDVMLENSHFPLSHFFLCSAESLIFLRSSLRAEVYSKVITNSHIMLLITHHFCCKLNSPRTMTVLGFQRKFNHAKTINKSTIFQKKTQTRNSFLCFRVTYWKSRVYVVESMILCSKSEFRRNFGTHFSKRSVSFHQPTQCSLCTFDFKTAILFLLFR